MTERETILVISPSLGIGGRERIAINTVRCLKSLGYRAILVVFQRRDVEYPFFGERIDLDVPARNGTIQKVIAQIRRSTRLLRLRKRYKTSFVYSLGETANFSNVLSGLTHRGKTIVAIHGFGEIRKSFLNRFVYSRADRVVCIAQDMRHQLLSLYPDLKGVAVIENGYELAERKGTRTPSSSLRLAAMGRLSRIKGFERMIESMAILRKSIPEATLTIIGDGEQRAELTALAQRLGLEKAIQFVGFLAEPFPVLREHDTFVLTSYSEGFPNALIEAMNQGLPVVAADCRSGPREILSGEYTPDPVQGIMREKYGVLVENSPDGFEERFAQAVTRLWRDRKKMAYYQRVGPQRAADFSLERYQEKLKQLLEELDHE